jgi:protocatechuate 3,4-dioxygenase, alpha subunit
MSLAQSPSQTIGPMYGYALYEAGMDSTVEAGDPQAVTLEGLLLDGDDEPIPYPEGLIEVWQGDQFARARTDAFGVWRVRVRKPDSLPPLPDASPQAPHLNVTVFARGLLKQAQTRVYFPDETTANSTDPILGLVDPDRRELLIAQRLQDGTLKFDIRIQGDRETVFFEF